MSGPGIDTSMFASCVRRRALPLLSLAAAAVAGVVVWFATRPPGAPSLGTLPIVRGALVADDNVSGSLVQSDINANQYRFVVLAGTHGMSDRTLLLRELDVMQAHGWGSPTVLGSTALLDCESAAIFDSIGSTRKCRPPAANRTVATVLNDQYAYVRLRRANGEVAADISIVRTRWFRGTGEPVGVVSSSSVATLIHAGRPVLLIELGRPAILN